MDFVHSSCDQTCGQDGEDAGPLLDSETVDAPAEQRAVVHLGAGDVLRHAVRVVHEHLQFIVQNGVKPAAVEDLGWWNVPQFCAGVELPPKVLL